MYARKAERERRARLEAERVIDSKSLQIYEMNNRLMKMLGDGDTLKLMQQTELEYMRDQSRNMHLIDEELYFVVEEKNHNIDLTEKGRLFMAEGQDVDMFVLPDIATELSQ